MVACALPDPSVGVALRLSGYLDCQARTLGENGFQALAGGPVATGLLLSLVTIFVALIGYRLILGQTPALHDGVGWTVRLGLVLALVTSWPAFQTLVYNVAVGGPGELAALLLPASGLPSESLDARVQSAYDTMRLNVAGTNQTMLNDSEQTGLGSSVSRAPKTGDFGYTLPAQTVWTFVITTIGVTSAFQVAVGFLLAVAPIAILALLFDATLGIFSGWVRALAGAALGGLAATIVTALDLVAVESELASLHASALGGVGEMIDTQALTTIVLLFGVVMLVASIAAVRMMGTFRLPLPGGRRAIEAYYREPASPGRLLSATNARDRVQGAADGKASVLAQPRAAAIANALTATIRREQIVNAPGSTGYAPSRHLPVAEGAGRTLSGAASAPIGLAGRRSTARRTRLAVRRDRTT